MAQNEVGTDMVHRLMEGFNNYPSQGGADQAISAGGGRRTEALLGSDAGSQHHPGKESGEVNWMLARWASFWSIFPARPGTIPAGIASPNPDIRLPGK